MQYLFIKGSSNSKWELVTTSHTYDDNENISLENGSYNYNTKTFNENYCHMIYPCLIYVNENTKNLSEKYRKTQNPKIRCPPHAIMV